MLTTLNDLYAGVLDEQAWSRALVSLSDMINGSGTVLLAHDTRSNGLVRAEAHRFDANLIDAYGRNWAEQDCRVSEGVGLQPGSPQYERQTVGLHRWRRTAIYNDFLRPNDIPYSMSLYLARESHRATVLTIQSSRRRGPFDAQDAAKLAPLLPHLSRAAFLRDQFEAAARWTSVSRWLSDHLPFGVLVLDVRGALLAANSEARSKISRSGPLLLDDDGRLDVFEPARTHWVRARAESRFGFSKEVHSADGTQSILLLVVPARHHLVDAAPRGYWLALTFDRKRSPPFNSRLLQSTTGLSPQQARLACLLAAGHDLDSAASTLGIRTLTARAYLKSIAMKLHLSTQSELVRFVHRSAATLNSTP